MLTLEEAQSRLLALAPKPETETCAIEASLGRYLAGPLKAARTQPPADLSAMDGYAICGHGPWVLVGESRAGAPFDGALEPGQCVRISTGAHMPSGADRVLIQENAAVELDEVRCTQDMPDAGKHVRRRGFDFADGDRLLDTGTRLGPAQIALAMAGGHAHLGVARRPLVAILDSGDELCADPGDCGPDQIPASNGAMLAAMLAQQGCETRRIGPVADDMDALAAALRESETADILVTSGGASVGDHDLMRPALERWGATLDFWKVAIKPGKPLMVATRGKQVIVGLPGNPVSSFVTAFLFVLPLVRAAMGAGKPLPSQCRVDSGDHLPEGGSRREFLRAYWDGQVARCVDSQDSSALAALASANCLIDRPAEAASVETGEAVVAFLLENGGIA
ncbi:molybdopterin molybdochelatase [Altererythrobacter xiamenensis]|uniref:Molybdopterin molybdenumtransferase n=1 Tax=Altererythrobacter xiamenensis TaxID=1316679 RepID=A0A1Y6FIC8_9SPHN|nr:molybdopterin molybdotransferase MoeA [Altererythrobacter xiamenensis]SMQ74595.1 molybdopterin molybdochelatase [Altererythrobacter xiamenensis]